MFDNKILLNKRENEKYFVKIKTAKLNLKQIMYSEKYM